MMIKMPKFLECCTSNIGVVEHFDRPHDEFLIANWDESLRESACKRVEIETSATCQN